MQAEGRPPGSPDAPAAVPDPALARLLERATRAELQRAGLDPICARFWAAALPGPAWRAAAAFDATATAEEGAPVDPLAYIQVKRAATAAVPSPSSDPRDAAWVPGVVLHRSLLHRRMRARVPRPRILLLAGALEYHRTEGRLASLETLIDQEREHLRRSALRIAALRPDLVLVERGVARTAQELLLAQQISVAVNVPRADLEHVARCTGATLVPSLESLAPPGAGGDAAASEQVLGTCGLFTADPAPPTAAHAKPLMIFRDCPLPRGATLLLRGPDLTELAAVKAAARTCVTLAYRLRLESTFLQSLLPLRLAASPGAAAPPSLDPTPVIAALASPTRPLRSTALYAETVWSAAAHAICQGPLQSSLDILQGVDLPLPRLFPSLATHFNRPCPAVKCQAPLGTHLRHFCFGNIRCGRFF